MNYPTVIKKKKKRVVSPLGTGMLTTFYVYSFIYFSKAAAYEGNITVKSLNPR